MNELKQEIAELRAEVKEVKKRLTFTIDATKIEVFVPIVGHPEYRISSFGRVWRRRDDFYPKISLVGSGYYRVTLNKRSYPLHRLIAQTFIPNPEGLDHVGHIDGNQLNNSILNLAWMTKEEYRQSKREQRQNNKGSKKVVYHKGTRGYNAFIGMGDGTWEYLGLHRSVKAANDAYEKAAKGLHKGFYRP